MIDFGGNEELHNQLSVLKLTPGFANVESLLIMRDAERNAEGAIKQISASLGKVNLPVPEGPGVWVSQGGKLKVGYLLFPDCNNIAKEGTLEDLCLSILKQSDYIKVLEEIRRFLVLLKQNCQREFSHEFKTRLHTYFSVTDKFVGMKIGEAAEAQAFDWNHDKVSFFKSFLLAAQCVNQKNNVMIARPVGD